MEKCYGCGATAPEHPIVGVMNSADVEKGTETFANPGGQDNPFIGVAVCKACHVDPAHRKAHALKCHFFERGRQATLGLVMAGADSIGSL